MTECRVCKCKLDLDKKFTNKLNENIYLCKNCKTYFINPVAHSYEETGESILKYYKLREVPTIKRLEKIFNKFLNMNPEGNSLLDIGAAVGYSGLVAKKFNLNYMGLEPSKTLYKSAIENLKVNVINDYFPSNEIKQKFDFIILDNVLEHIYSPKVFFDEIVEYLNPEGILFLAVPPQDWLRILLSSNKVLSNAPEKISRRLTMFYDLKQHVNYFSYKSIKKLVENNKDLNSIQQFHIKGWALNIYLLLGLTTGHYFIQKKGK
jgi:2-polyprenyl-3-methyl-5-hydroxy-6-metoxy-1,4-benzoquinol methylase